jgi:hypothetical protein
MELPVNNNRYCDRVDEGASNAIVFENVDVSEELGDSIKSVTWMLKRARE